VDVYAMGAMLYEALTGRPPFQATTVGAVLLQHMTARVPELRSLGLEIPRTLDEIVQRLLRKDPRDRYQSADAVLSDVAMIRSPANPGNEFAFRDTESAATPLRLKIHSVPVTSANDVDSALASIARMKPGALIVQPSAALGFDDVQRIGELAVKLRIVSPVDAAERPLAEDRL
jgi:serine/threonine protein kinase